MTGNQQQWHTRWIIALFVLSAMSMSIIVLFVLYTPSNLVQSRVCLFPLGDSLLSDVCSPGGEGADVLATDEGKLVSGNKTKELGFTLDEEEDIDYIHLRTPRNGGLHDRCEEAVAVGEEEPR